MKHFDKCPICGGELEEKQVEKVLYGGQNTVIVKVTAEVCLHCGERLYTEKTVRYFQALRLKLKRHEFSDFRPVGQTFLVAE